MRVGIFDSGVGGLNVLKELIKVYPNNHYIYYGDTLNVPYGNKSKEELLNLSSKIIKFLEDKSVDLIIIACGTISSNCYLELKEKCSCPLYNIIDPTINYINNSSYKNIGLIGTTKTIESRIFENNLINKNIFSKDTPSFVPIIENNLINSKKEDIFRELSFCKDKVDCLILGCTHYPLLSNVINDYLNIPLIDMGKCLLEEISFNDLSSELKIDLYFSKIDDCLLKNINMIITCHKNIYEV